MSEKVLILGYYNRQNFGDELFARVYRDVIFKDTDTDLTICNIDDFAWDDSESFHKVVIGGGDLINSYFFTDDRINAFRAKFVNTPIFFHGIGITYPDLLPLLDIGDYFFMRNKIDYETVKYRYGALPSTYTPDLAFYLDPEPPTQQRVRSNKIGVVIPYTWIAARTYVPFMNGIVSLVTGLIAQNFQIYFIPFDNSQCDQNSDQLFIKAIRPALQSFEFNSQGQQQIFYTDTTGMTFDKMCSLFSQLDLCLASRFHSVVLSIMTRTPFVSMYSQRKIGLLKNDLPPGLQDCFIPLPLDDQGIPTSINVEAVNNKVNDVLSRWEKVQSTLDICYSIKYKKECDDALQIFKSAFASPQKRISPPQFISEADKQALVHKTVKAVLSNLDKLSIRNVNKVWDNIPLRSLLTKRNNTIHDSLAKSITEEILWHTTGDPYGPYYYGLTQNCLDNGLISQIKWLIDDYYLKYKYKETTATIINKNFQEVHRSGWQFIVNNLCTSSDKSSAGESSLIIDTYVDKTFHWNCQFYQDHGVIPYQNKWIGFIHHTYSSYNNTYNCDTLFKNQVFISSLKHCRSLVVMSEYLADRVRASMKSLEIDVPVSVVSHPSEPTDIVFEWNNFLAAWDRPLVQVGSWLRNVFSIFPLELPKGSLVTRKAVLKNKNSDNYFLPSDFLQKFLDFSQPSSNDASDAVDICRMSFHNMHVKGLCQHIVDIEASVQVLEYLTNEEYDKLLTTSIIFIHLVDASAVNTIIECILRATPILVNPIPPVVELLGEDYPLYYNTMFEASTLLSDESKLKAGWEYLRKMDKTKFKISTFLTDLQTIISQLC